MNAKNILLTENERKFLADLVAGRATAPFWADDARHALIKKLTEK